jgi:hypothetical protein
MSRLGVSALRRCSPLYGCYRAKRRKQTNNNEYAMQQHRNSSTKTGRTEKERKKEKEWSYPNAQPSQIPQRKQVSEITIFKNALKDRAFKVRTCMVNITQTLSWQGDALCGIACWAKTDDQRSQRTKASPQDSKQASLFHFIGSRCAGYSEVPNMGRFQKAAHEAGERVSLRTRAQNRQTAESGKRS